VQTQWWDFRDGLNRQGGDFPLALGASAMGIDWMNRAELAEAIPPAYTEWIGQRLLAAL
jgi:DNA (cytosine-5)-methyltransferase 1